MKVGVRDRVQAVVFAYETGLVSPGRHPPASPYAGRPSDIRDRGASRWQLLQGTTLGMAENRPWGAGGEGGRGAAGDHEGMGRYPPETRYAAASGAKIAYQASGTGPPDLVLVPGLVSHLDLQWQQTGYRRFVRALERGARLIRLDKRGTGLSDPCAGLPTTEERVRDVAAVMAAAKSSRAVLFGLSDGGRAAIAFAAAHPGRTRGLILYGTSYRGPRAVMLRRYRSMVRHWGEGQIIDLMAPSAANPETRRAAGAFERAAASPAMAAALIESLGLIDVRDLMSGLAVPALVLHREGDIITPVADARLVAGQIPGAALRILPGEDHLPWVGDWAPVADEILAFLDQVTPARPRPGPGRGRARLGRPAVGWSSLTEAELPVVRLAAEGHANADIAVRLCLSRYTVETHLKHVFAKLGVESRTELAALAARQDEGGRTNT
jgi:pimeloyl-ACP methyl ester carboxylesterase/DNA-binding CsgD family transcriptional regulator